LPNSTQVTAIPTLTVQNVPSTLHAKLKRRAERHRRSLNDEVLAVLEDAAGSAEQPDDRQALIERIRKEREDGPTITADPDELKRMMREGLA
jgi:plasmid stability protein